MLTVGIQVIQHKFLLKHDSVRSYKRFHVTVVIVGSFVGITCVIANFYKLAINGRRSSLAGRALRELLLSHSVIEMYWRHCAI